MAKVRARGLEFEYDQFGDPSSPPLLLVMGLGAQMTSWDEDFCRLLASKGFHVTRFDNRDAGLSTHLDHMPVPAPLDVLQGKAEPAYTIEDMADDAAAVMDALGIAPAHIVGASMGGFIAQTLAIRDPEMVRSLTSIMSGPGGRDATPATPEAMTVLLAPPPVDREALIEHGVNISRVLHADFFDEGRARTKRAAAVDRAVSPEGTGRQLSAVMAQLSRVDALHGVRVPTLVIHGDADPLVPYPEGVRTAAAVPGARLMTLERVGHDIPPHTWKDVTQAIAEVANAAPEPAGSD